MKKTIILLLLLATCIISTVKLNQYIQDDVAAVYDDHETFLLLDNSDNLIDQNYNLSDLVEFNQNKIIFQKGQLMPTRRIVEWILWLTIIAVFNYLAVRGVDMLIKSKTA